MDGPTAPSLNRRVRLPGQSCLIDSWVAQRQSGRLLTVWSQVRILPQEPGWGEAG